MISKPPTRRASVVAAPGACVQQVYDGLRREILAGQLHPGETLSRQLIARRFGVSATPVIEALVRLEQTGLIEAEHGQMARVRRVTLESIQNDYMLREAIEVQTTRLACESATLAQIDELRRLGERIDVKYDDRAWRTRVGQDAGAHGVQHRRQADEGAALDSAFHRRLGEVSGYPALVHELDRIALAQHLRLGWLLPIAAEEPIRQHGLLVDLIARRDIAAAEAEMRAHVRRGLKDEILAYQQRMVKA